MDVLFIGNSYTGNLESAFTPMMGEVQPDATLRYKTGGGWTLARHVADPVVKQAIASHKWDRVVLQEQSRIPAFAYDSKAYRGHRESLRRLVEWTREQGAGPVLYETWGRRDGDAGASRRCPDFDTMQALLTRSYRDAAQELGALLVPVGRVWQAVRKANPELGHTLHARDGSHASACGSYLVAATFLRALLGINPATLKMTPPMPGGDVELIQRTVVSVVDSVCAGGEGAEAGAPR